MTNEELLLKKKLNELLYYVSGQQQYVSPFLETKKKFDSEKAQALAKELATLTVFDEEDEIYTFWDPDDINRQFSLGHTFMNFCEKYFYLALSICYFFEQHPALEMDFRWLNDEKFSFYGLQKLIKNNHFDSYMYYLNRNNYFNINDYLYHAKKEHDYIYIQSCHLFDANNSLADLQWYEKEWTESNESFEGTFDFLKLMYVLCNAIMQNGIIPKGGKSKLFSKKVKGEYPTDRFWYSDYYSCAEDYLGMYEEHEQESIREDFLQYRNSHSNDSCIKKLSEYIADFPEPKCFLDTYVEFRKFYLNIRLRELLPEQVGFGVQAFLNNNKVSLYAQPDAFKEIYHLTSFVVNKAKHYPKSNQ